MKAQDTNRLFSGTGLRSASIWCFQKEVKTQPISKNVTKQSFIKNGVSFLKKKAPAAACDSAKLKGYKHKKYGLFISIMIRISIFILISIWILISPHPTPCRGRPQTGPGGGAWGGVGGGDININIDINMNIDINIIMNIEMSIFNTHFRRKKWTVKKISKCQTK